MLKLTKVLGNAAEPGFAERLHELEHRGLIETITLDAQDTARKRFRTLTDRGTESVIILARDERLAHGAVLLLEPERAVIVRLSEPGWLCVQARDVAAAIELGYLAGNMHWQVRFDGETLSILLEGDGCSTARGSRS